MAEEIGIPFLGKIPLDPEIVESGERGKPVVLESDSKAADAFNGVISEIESSLKSASGR